MLYLDFHSAARIWNFAFVVLTLFGDNYQLCAIFWETTLWFRLANLKLSKWPRFVASQDFAENVTSWIFLLILLVFWMLNNEYMNSFTFWGTSQKLASICVVKNQRLNVCACATTTNLLKCFWLLLSVQDFSFKKTDYSTCFTSSGQDFACLV